MSHSKKSCLVVSIFMLMSYLCISQNNVSFEYTYDAAGNRTHRYFFNLKKQDISDPLTDSTLIADQSINEEDFINEENKVSNSIDDFIINIYPNPAHELLYIERNGGDMINVLLYQVIDPSGKIVTEDKIAAGSAKIEFANLPPGTYIVRIFTLKDAEEYKVIKF